MSRRQAASRGFQFSRRRQLFIRTHNETLSVVTMRVCNPDFSPVGINRMANEMRPDVTDNLAHAYFIPPSMSGLGPNELFSVVNDRVPPSILFPLRSCIVDVSHSVGRG